MTEESDDRRTPEESRRAVLRTGGIVSGGLVLGLSGTGGAAAVGATVDEATPEEAGARQQYPVGKAFMFNDEFRPGARFRVVSPVIDERPDVEAIQEQDVWTSADTRIIEYQNTGERVFLFPIRPADAEQGEVYELSSNTLALFDREVGIVSCEYSLPDPDAAAVEASEDYETVEGGGNALVRANNFYPGAFFRVDSGVVNLTPPEAVRRTDIFTDYNTRYGEYYNTSDEFLFYPAESAAFDEGGVYVLHDEFEFLDPGGGLVTTDVDRVDPTTLDDP